MLAERGLLRVVIEGDGATAAGSGTMANALELFAADASGPDAPVLQVYDNLAPGETLLRLPEDVTGEVVARFTSKLAELHILLPDVHETGRGMRLRRLNGPKSGAGQLCWNLEPTSARFDGKPVQSADSPRAGGRRHAGSGPWARARPVGAVARTHRAPDRHSGFKRRRRAACLRGGCPACGAGAAHRLIWRGQRS